MSDEEVEIQNPEKELNHLDEGYQPSEKKGYQPKQGPTATYTPPSGSSGVQNNNDKKK